MQLRVSLLLLTPGNFLREYRRHEYGRCSGSQVTDFNTDQLQIANIVWGGLFTWSEKCSLTIPKKLVGITLYCFAIFSPAQEGKEGEKGLPKSGTCCGKNYSP